MAKHERRRQTDGPRGPHQRLEAVASGEDHVSQPGSGLWHWFTKRLMGAGLLQEILAADSAPTPGGRAGAVPSLAPQGGPAGLAAAGADAAGASACAQALRDGGCPGHDLANAAREATAEAQRVVAMVSHEIRSPLNGVTGMLDLLQGTPLNDDQKELVDAAQSAARQLRILLDDLLDMSKANAGKISFESIPFDPRTSIGGPLRLFAVRARSKGLDFSARAELPPGCALLGDPFRINQVLGNLLDNALKFTARGRIDVVTQCTAIDMPGQDWGRPDQWELRVTVKDTGIGLRDEQLRRLFERFEQGDPSTARRFGGSGLGLSLCKRLSEGMGGGIAARPRPEGGSEFSFFVRCKDAQFLDASAFADTEPAEPCAANVLQGRRAMVVDDNRVNRTLLVRWLEEEGMQCVGAEDGAVALAQATSNVVDIILMDISMPVMDGIDATRAIRLQGATGQAERKHLATIPIIGVSARAMDGDREGCLEAGMTDYVTKPLERKRLLECLRRALDVEGSPGPHGAAASMLRLDLDP
jgi:signal transduction histidine kinase/FixJ family two-component response regulator